MPRAPALPAELHAIDAYWRAANYLSRRPDLPADNPLLRQPLTLDHIKPRLLGHWGTTPGLNFIYAHLNRVIRRDDLDMIFIAGPGHGGPGVVANTYLEGTYSELYPDVSRDLAGLQRLFKQFSFPGGIPSHAAPETPGSIHEGGELGYSLAHAFGAAFDNPGLIVACVVGDGEAETGPLATAGTRTSSSTRTDGACSRSSTSTATRSPPRPCSPGSAARSWSISSWGTAIVRTWWRARSPQAAHQAMAATLDAALQDIHTIQSKARATGEATRPRWPMIILRTPKGWTGPKEVDGKQTEGSWRSHQVPLADMQTKPEHVRQLEQWMRSYRPEELFDEAGALVPELAALAPQGDRRMSANPHANGGVLLQDLSLPDFRDYAVSVPSPGTVTGEATRTLGGFLRDVMRQNDAQRNFRVFGPDETASNRLDALFEVTDRTWLADRLPGDEQLGPDGRVMEILSEHTCQGWLEGYLLTGRHGLFSCYEAFVHIVDSMFNQHAKWLKVTRQRPIRR